jgi:predicted RNA methylase
LLRDPHQVYDAFELDPGNFDDRVWMGADSIIFARFIKKYLKNKSYNKTIEIGSGTGIQIIVSSKFSKACTAFDCNNRAVQYTKLNVAINRIKNIETYYSNMFENVEGKFDLMLANPWFIDLEKGGLEEVPDIMKRLEHYLSKDGLCLLLLNSYIKKGKDTVYDYLKSFVESKDYDLDLYTIGYNIETFRIKEYKKYGVDYCVGYYAVIKKSGKGIIKRYEVSLFRKIRDFTFIKACHIINKF